VIKNCHFACLKTPKQHGQGNFLENLKKQSSHLNEESYEITKIFGEFGQIFIFLLLELVYSPSSF
jgi:hypothetical protein